MHCIAKQAALHGCKMTYIQAHLIKALIFRPRILPCMDVSQGDGMWEERGAHRQKVPVWPVVSTPAKNSAAISGNILASVRGFPVLGSFAFSSSSAKLPLCSSVFLMWLSSPRTMFYTATSKLRAPDPSSQNATLQ